MREEKKTLAIPTRGLLAGSLILVLTIVSASSSVDESVSKFPELVCEADAKVGLHDVLEDAAPVESYETRVIATAGFRLSENLTFRDLLGDEDVDLYLSFQAEGSKDVHEYTCRRIKGLGSRKGYSCVNNPPSELLTLDPTTLRFARASVGAWTLYTAAETGTSATLFVEKGMCYFANAEESTKKD